MTVTSSSLSRLVVLFERAAKNSTSEPAFSQWAVFLGIVKVRAELDRRATIVTLRAMALLNEELERARLSLDGGPFELSDYEAAFNRAQKTIDIQQLNQPWADLAQNLGAETLNALRMCSRVVPVTEQLLSASELGELDAAIVEVERALENLPATDGLVRVLAEHLMIMKQARVDYKIAGASVFRRAVYGLEAAMFYHTSPKTEHESPAHAAAVASTIRLVRAVKTVLATASVAVALGGAVEGVLHIAEAAATAEMFYLNSGPPLDDSPSK